MPENPQEFAKALREWSRWKHEILDKYLKPFTGKLQGFQTIMYVDGFAGPGMYKDGKKGSALRAAILAKIIDTNQTYKLHCINVELDDGVFDLLIKNTQQFSDYISYYKGKFSEHINSIIDEIADQPALFFIDPFGFSDVEWNTLLPVFERKSTQHKYTVTEALIRFDAPYVSRYAGCIGKTDSISRNNVRILLDLYGLSSEEEWLNLISQTGNDYEGLASAYQFRLKEHFDYVLRVPIRSENDLLKYYLIFATRHKGAVSAMNNVVYKVEDMRANVLDRFDGGNIMLPGMDDYDVLSELETLKKIVKQLLPLGKTIDRDALITRVATHENYFGAFSTSHFTAVLGGRARLTIPKEFTSLKDDLRLKGTPGKAKTLITRIR